ncbi:DUF5995 family protein [Paenibacillus kobensis]|uniref:DUF5995 family protein n=1 Tax=Paenibacillus kobensis TaxID=59841 RepID=UPI000FD93431|nr:DUF5995 family protein [Paenibacillus kobensis]
MSALDFHQINGTAKTIDEVLERLDRIIQYSIDTGNRIGYFTAMYRTVTARVKAEIEAGRFEDGKRMERLDVCFANRFLDAYASYSSGGRCSQCWRIAFEAAEQSKPLILQHLLLGMNAHINYDLGIAAVDTCPGETLPSLHHDFNIINDILASMIDEVKRDLDSLSPWIGWLDEQDGKAADTIIRFSMNKARSYAWTFAMNLAKDSQHKLELMARKGAETAVLGQDVLRPPGLLFKAILWFVRLRESNDVVHNITILSESSSAWSGPHNSGTLSG